MNGSELGRALGVSDVTVSRYLDILEGTFMALRLPAWRANPGKREVKSPKVYLADTGLLHSLMGIDDAQGLLAHPKCGASWEGFMLQCHAEGEPWPLAEKITAVPAGLLASPGWQPLQ